MTGHRFHAMDDLGIHIHIHIIDTPAFFAYKVVVWMNIPIKAVKRGSKLEFLDFSHFQKDIEIPIDSPQAQSGIIIF